jgi:hypothetical protein
MASVDSTMGHGLGWELLADVVTYASRTSHRTGTSDDAATVEHLLGAYKEAEVLIATPPSGWFRCASERGTGIAVARWLARSLAQRGCRVALLGTSGHELFNIGLERYLATHTISESVKAIVHVGASVAARSHLQPDLLSESLYVTSNVKGIGAELGSVGFRQRLGGVDRKDWIGEGTRWCTVGLPLLSVAGISHWFHTPEDTADRTTPELLERVAERLLADCLALLDSGVNLNR